MRAWHEVSTIGTMIRLRIKLDLRQYGKRSLSEELKGGKLESIKGPIVLQIQKIRNISAPKANEESNHAPRLLKLHLTDGHLTLHGLEMSSIPQLSLSTPPGTKICLTGSNISAQNGFILMNSSNTKVLGGEVEKLATKWQLNKSLVHHPRKAVATEGGPPPFVPFAAFKSATNKGKVHNNDRNKDFQNTMNNTEKSNNNGHLKESSTRNKYNDTDKNQRSRQDHQDGKENSYKKENEKWEKGANNSRPKSTNHNPRETRKFNNERPLARQNYDEKSGSEGREKNNDRLAYSGGQGEREYSGRKPAFERNKTKASGQSDRPNSSRTNHEKVSLLSRGESSRLTEESSPQVHQGGGKRGRGGTRNMRSEPGRRESQGKGHGSDFGGIESEDYRTRQPLQMWDYVESKMPESKKKNSDLAVPSKEFVEQSQQKKEDSRKSQMQDNRKSDVRVIAEEETSKAKELNLIENKNDKVEQEGQLVCDEQARKQSNIPPELQTRSNTQQKTTNQQQSSCSEQQQQYQLQQQQQLQLQQQQQQQYQQHQHQQNQQQQHQQNQQQHQQQHKQQQQNQQKQHQQQQQKQQNQQKQQYPPQQQNQQKQYQQQQQQQPNQQQKQYQQQQKQQHQQEQHHKQNPKGEHHNYQRQQQNTGRPPGRGSKARYEDSRQHQTLPPRLQKKHQQQHHQYVKEFLQQEKQSSSQRRESSTPPQQSGQSSPYEASGRRHSPNNQSRPDSSHRHYTGAQQQGRKPRTGQGQQQQLVSLTQNYESPQQVEQRFSPSEYQQQTQYGASASPQGQSPYPSEQLAVQYDPNSGREYQIQQQPQIASQAIPVYQVPTTLMQQVATAPQMIAQHALQQQHQPVPNQMQAPQVAWKKGDFCLSMWRDGQCYSAKIDEIFPDGTSCKITFLDFGNSEVVPVNTLSAIPIVTWSEANRVQAPAVSTVALPVYAAPQPVSIVPRPQVMIPVSRQPSYPVTQRPVVPQATPVLPQQVWQPQITYEMRPQGYQPQMVQYGSIPQPNNSASQGQGYYQSVASGGVQYVSNFGQNDVSGPFGMEMESPRNVPKTNPGYSKPKRQGKPTQQYYVAPRHQKHRENSSDS